MQNPLEIVRQITESSPVRIACRCAGNKKGEDYSIDWKGKEFVISAETPLAAAYGASYLATALKRKRFQGLSGMYAPCFQRRLFYSLKPSLLPPEEFCRRLIVCGFNGAVVKEGDPAVGELEHQGLYILPGSVFEGKITASEEQTQLDAVLEYAKGRKYLYLPFSKRQDKWLPELLNRLSFDTALLFSAFHEGKPHPLWDLLLQNPAPSAAPLIPLLDISKDLSQLRFLQERSTTHHFAGAVCLADKDPDDRLHSAGHALFTGLPPSMLDI